MPPPTTDSKRSKKSNKKKNASGRKTDNNKAPGGFQRVDAIEKLPSNAPTMAIAPSDYEHIFHEAAGLPAAASTIPQTPAYTPSPPPPPLNIPKPRTPEPVFMPPPPPPPIVVERPEPARPAPVPTSYGQNLQFGTDIQVTPDGYTLLGQIPDGRRVPLPPYVVRANNQFSRPVLAKVGRYLLSRIETPR